MIVRTIVQIVIVSLSLFLTACGDDSGGGNGKRGVGPDRSGAGKFAVGRTHACAVLKTGKLVCWGGNGSKQLGDGSGVNRSIPVAVNLDEGRTVIGLDVGDEHTVAILDDGSLVSWGNNGGGRLGRGAGAPTSPATVNLGEKRSAVEVSLGSEHSCAILDDGSLQCWGANTYGQVGDGTHRNSRLTPVSVDTGGVKVRAVSACARHTCALLHDGKILCWGVNSVGQLGDGQSSGTSGSLIPVTVSIDANRTAVAMAGGGEPQLRPIG